MNYWDDIDLNIATAIQFQFELFELWWIIEK
jgi:hypothetical protein